MLRLFVAALIFFATYMGHLPSAIDPAWLLARANAQAVSRPLRPLNLPVLLDGRSLGEVQALAQGGEADPVLIWDSLRRLLLEIPLSTERIEAIEAQRRPDGRVDIDAIRASGLQARIDRATASLVLNVPVDLRGAVPLDLGNRTGRYLGPRFDAADVSAFINFRFGLDYLHHSNGFEGRQPLTVGLDGAFAARGFTLEGLLNYVEDNQYPWQRGDVRLIHDDAPQAVRYQAGDISIPTSGFQSFQGGGGIAVSRLFELQPGRQSQPIAQREITLNSESDVEVIVNGRRDRILRLPPGRYNLRDLPVLSGVNDVQLRVTDATGREQIISVPFFSTPILLRAGEQDFSYAISAPYLDTERNRRYLTDNVGFSAFHRYGLNDVLTIGTNFQGNREQQMAGLEASLALGLGAIRLDMAASRLDKNEFHNGGTGSGAQLTYEYFDAGIAGNPAQSFIASINYESRDLAPLGVIAPNNNSIIDASARYSREIVNDITLGVSTAYRLQRRNNRHSDLQGVFLQANLGDGVFTSVTAERRNGAFSPDETVEYRTLFSLSFRIGGRNYLQTSYDSRDSTRQMNWSNSSRSPVFEPTASIQALKSENAQSINGNFNYRTYRTETLLIHDEGWSDDGDRLRSRTGLRFGTALVMADGVFGVSRPVSNGFAIVKPHPSMKDQVLHIDPIDDNPSLVADWTGPAVLPNLTPYQPRIVNFTAPGLPFGRDIGIGSAQINAYYKSGVVVTVGSEATILLEGILLDEKDQELSLESGGIRSESGHIIRSFFTNRKGRFRIDGLVPGIYILNLLSQPGLEHRLEIPAAAEGVYSIGKIVITAREAP